MTKTRSKRPERPDEIEERDGREHAAERRERHVTELPGGPAAVDRRRLVELVGDGRRAPPGASPSENGNDRQTLTSVTDRSAVRGSPSQLMVAFRSRRPSVVRNPLSTPNGFSTSAQIMPATTRGEEPRQDQEAPEQAAQPRRDPGVEQKREAEPDHEVGDHAPRGEEDRLPGGLPEGRRSGRGPCSSRARPSDPRGR